MSDWKSVLHLRRENDVRIFSVADSRLKWIRKHYDAMMRFYGPIVGFEAFDNACEAFLLGFIDSEDVVRYAKILDNESDKLF